MLHAVIVITLFLFFCLVVVYGTDNVIPIFFVYIISVSNSTASSSMSFCLEQIAIHKYISSASAPGPSLFKCQGSLDG